MSCRILHSFCCSSITLQRVAPLVVLQPLLGMPTSTLLVRVHACARNPSTGVTAGSDSNLLDPFPPPNPHHPHHYHHHHHYHHPHPHPHPHHTNIIFWGGGPIFLKSGDLKILFFFFPDLLIKPKNTWKKIILPRPPRFEPGPLPTLVLIN